MWINLIIQTLKRYYLFQWKNYTQKNISGWKISKKDTNDSSNFSWNWKSVNTLLLFHKFCVVIQEWTFLVIPSIYVVNCIRKKYCAFYIVNFVCMRCKILQSFVKIMMKIIFQYTIYKNSVFWKYYRFE